MSGQDWADFANAFARTFHPGTPGAAQDRRDAREERKLRMEQLQHELDDYPANKAYQDEYRQLQLDQMREEKKNRGAGKPENDPNFDPNKLMSPGSSIDTGPGSHDTSMISGATSNPGLAGNSASDRISNDYYNQIGDSAKNYVWPVTGTYSGGGSAYGAGRWHRQHSGIDISAADGSIVRAAYPGTVVGAKYSPGGQHTIGYRGEVLVKGNDGYVYRYAMHGDRLVKAGDTVNAGDPLGKVANGHLHWEIIPPGSPAYRSLASGNFVPTTTHKGSHPTLDPAHFFGLSPGASFVGGDAMVLHGGTGADALSATSGIPTPTRNADTGYDPVSANPELQGRPEMSDALRMLQDRNAQMGLPDVADPNSSQLGYNPNSRMRGNPPSPVGVSAPTGYDAGPNPELRGKPEQIDQIQALQDRNAQKGLDPAVATPGAIPIPRTRPDNAPVAAAVPIPRTRPDNAPAADAGVAAGGRPAVTPAVTAPTPQSPAVDAAARRGGRGLARLSGDDRQAVIDVANQFGISPAVLLSVIGYETAGTYSPNIMSPTGFLGLIQFGAREQKAFGVRRGMSFADQLRGPVVAYFKQRGLKPGMGLPEIYSIINAGSLTKDGQPRWGAHDAPGHDLRYHLRIIAGNFTPAARQFLGDAAGPATGLEGHPVPIPRTRPGAIATPASAPAANSAPPDASVPAAGTLPPAGTDAYNSWLESGHTAALVGTKAALGIGGSAGNTSLAGGGDTGGDTLGGGAAGDGSGAGSPADVAGAAADAAIPAPGVEFPPLPSLSPGETNYDVAAYINRQEEAMKAAYPDMPEGTRSLTSMGMIYNYFMSRHQTRAAMETAREAVVYHNDKFNQYQAIAEEAVTTGHIDDAVAAAVKAWNSTLGGVTYSATKQADGKYRVQGTKEGAIVHDTVMTPSEVATGIMGMTDKTFYEAMVQGSGARVPSDAYYTAAEELAKNGTISSATMAAVKDPKESGYLRAQENIYKRGSALDSAAARAAATATANKALTAAAKTQDAPAEVYAAADAGAQKAYDAAGDKVKTKGRAAAVTDAIAYYTTHKTLSPELVNRLTGFDGGMDAFDKARGELEAGDKFKNDQATADAAAAAAKRLADKDTQDKLGPVRKLTLQEQTDIATTASGIIDNAQTDLFPGVNEQAKISLKHTIALAAQDLVAYSDRGDMSPEEATDFAYRYITQPTQFTVKKPGANDPDPDHTILTDKLNDLSIRVPNSTAKALGRAMFLATPPKTVSPPDERPTGPARTSPPPAEPFVAPQPNYLPGAGGEMFPTPPGRTIRPEPFAGPTRP